MGRYAVWVSKGAFVLFLSIRDTVREILDREFVHHQKCKACGHRDKFDFHVPDEIWNRVVPHRLRGRVVCLACFDRFAKERGVEYAPHVTELSFAGDKASFLFHVADEAST